MSLKLFSNQDDSTIEKLFPDGIPESITVKSDLNVYDEINSMLDEKKKDKKKKKKYYKEDSEEEDDIESKKFDNIKFEINSEIKKKKILNKDEDEDEDSEDEEDITEIKNLNIEGRTRRIHRPGKGKRIVKGGGMIKKHPAKLPAFYHGKQRYKHMPSYSRYYSGQRYRKWRKLYRDRNFFGYKYFLPRYVRPIDISITRPWFMPYKIWLMLLQKGYNTITWDNIPEWWDVETMGIWPPPMNYKNDPEYMNYGQYYVPNIKKFVEEYK